VGNAVFHCTGSHGPIALHEAIIRSCDIYWYAMGRRVGIGPLSGMARNMGLGGRYDLPFPSQPFGTVPDAAHTSGYDVSPRRIRAAGPWDSDYSTRQARDRTSPDSDYCSAFDIGDDWPNGGRAAWLRWNNLLLRGLQGADPALAAVRAINVSRDGRERKRYDTANRGQGLVDSTDPVTSHTHGETWRDTIGTAALDRAFRRIEAMAEAAIANRPLTAAEEPIVPTLSTANANAGENIEAQISALLKLEPVKVGSLPAGNVKGMIGEAYPMPNVLAAKLAEILAAAQAGGGQVTPTPEQWAALTASITTTVEQLFATKVGQAAELAAEAAIRRVLGAIDGATPPAV
jgi:cell division protein FtsI/penicillin-binding protein 2